jgi:hypothetical protein
MHFDTKILACNAKTRSVHLSTQATLIKRVSAKKKLTTKRIATLKISQKCLPAKQ